MQITVTLIINWLTLSDEPCPANQTRCDSGECILSEWFCDDYGDCADRSDELMCCPDSQFNCDNGRCIEWDSWCDGNDDCRDNSDEAECVGKLIAKWQRTVIIKCVQSMKYGVHPLR